MFPGPNAQVYYNEAGEPLGWDNVYFDEPQDLDEYYERLEEERWCDEEEEEDAERE